ncbi:MAG: hypothetical protein LBV72_18010 [Tannerella sp.]|jgi:hypothetical protein|nr:hypothetical protein [Tannerella sp.]
MVKKIFLAFTLMSCFFFHANAQDLFAKGDKVVSVGVGIGSYLGGSGYKMSVPPILATYDQCIIDGLIKGKASIGVGGYLAYTANKWETTISGYDYGYKYSYMIIGARGTFHYQAMDKLDTYGGAMLGYDIVNSRYFGDDAYSAASKASGSELAYSLFVGARYYFMDNLAAFAEVGYGIAALELGISYKF